MSNILSYDALIDVFLNTSDGHTAIVIVHLSSSGDTPTWTLEAAQHAASSALSKPVQMTKIAREGN